jgi:hypothetical protein
MTFPQSGGCLCGAVRYTQLGPALSVQHCHCSRCRRRYGMLAAQGAVIERAKIRIDGEANLTTYASADAPGYATQFCRTCGCHLFAREAGEPKLMYFMPATLDGGRHPGHPADKECHIHFGSKAEWDRTADDLPKYETTSPDEIMTELQRSERN